jgi:ABC-type transporter Mla subunit MlaD
VWQQTLAQSVKGNDQNLNNVLGNLPTFAANASDILRVLDVQHQAVVGLVRNGGTVFAALSQDQGALRNLITSGDRTFATTAANQAALADTFHVFPTFLDESKRTMAKLKSFDLNADPVLRELNPAVRQLAPTLHSVQLLAPDLRRLFTKLGPLIQVSRAGLPATAEVVSGARPLLGALGPFLEQLNPIFDWLSLHQQLTSDFISQGGGAIAGEIDSSSYGGGGGITCAGGVPCGHYLRQFSPSSSTANNNARDPNNRGNDYPPPLWLADPRNFSAGGRYPGSTSYPSWDCNNTPTHGPKPVTGTPGQPSANQACWVDHPPGSVGSQIPHVKAAHYSSR